MAPETVRETPAGAPPFAENAVVGCMVGRAQAPERKKGFTGSGAPTGSTVYLDGAGDSGFPRHGPREGAPDRNSQTAAGGMGNRMKETPAGTTIERIEKKKGGRRPGAGMPKGYKTRKTLEKEQARELARQHITKWLIPLLDTAIENALGIRH